MVWTTLNLAQRMGPGHSERGSHRWARGPHRWMAGVAAVSVLTLLFFAPDTHGQDPDTLDSVPSVEIESLGGDVHLLRIRDGEGGWVNAVTLVTDDGALLVDHAGDWRTLDVAPSVVDMVRNALAELGVGSVRFLVNTHWHGDHTAANPDFQEAVIVAHAGTRARLVARQEPWWYPDGIGPMEPGGLPDVVFETSLTLHMGDERVHLWHFGPAHTDGDAVVYFERARVAHLGDLYHGLRNPSMGEDMPGLAHTLRAAADRMDPETRVVTGHTGVTTVTEMLEYQAMLVETIAHVEGQLAAGADLEAIQARGLPDAWVDVVQDPAVVSAWLTEIHRSLARP